MKPYRREAKAAAPPMNVPGRRILNGEDARTKLFPKHRATPLPSGKALPLF